MRRTAETRGGPSSLQARGMDEESRVDDAPSPLSRQGEFAVSGDGSLSEEGGDSQSSEADSDCSEASVFWPPREAAEQSFLLHILLAALLTPHPREQPEEAVGQFPLSARR